LNLLLIRNVAVSPVRYCFLSGTTSISGYGMPRSEYSPLVTHR